MLEEKHIKERIDKLKKLSIFDGIKDNHDSLKNIAEILQVEKYSSSQSVISEGADGNSLYIIKFGTVEILKKTKHGDEYVVTELSADMNIFFGELALIDPDKRSATVRCKTDSEFYKLTRDNFIKFGDQNPVAGLAITREISKILCQRNRKSNIDILTLFDALVEEVEISGGIS